MHVYYNIHGYIILYYSFGSLKNHFTSNFQGLPAIEELPRSPAIEEHPETLIYAALKNLQQACH